MNLKRLLTLPALLILLLSLAQLLLACGEIEKVEFLSSREATIKIATSLSSVVGSTDDKLLCLVTIRGSFAMAGSPPVPGQTVGTAKTFSHAFQLFDAQTGNLILMGGLAN